MKNQLCIVTGAWFSSVCANCKWSQHNNPGADDRSELSISGYYFQQNFRYKNLLFLTGAIRVDGSSVFGEDQRNQKYYKASGSYVISEHEFWKNSSINNF